MTTSWNLVRGPYPAILGTDWRDGTIAAFYHPQEKCVWLAALNSDRGGIFRLVDGEPRLVCDRAALGRRQCNWAEVFFYFDTATERPTLLGDDWEGKNVGQMQAAAKAGTVSTLFALEIDRAGVVQKRELGVSGQFEGYTDRFVVDPHGQLFHFARPNHQPAQLRRLDAGGFTVVSDTPEALHAAGNLAACVGTYDRTLGAFVFLFADRTWLYRDGRGWTDLAGPRSKHLRKNEQLATDPTTGHALFVRGSNDDDSAPTIERFDGERWQPTHPGPAHYRAIVTTPDALVFVQAQVAPDRPLRAWVSWDPRTGAFTEGGPVLDRPVRIASGAAGTLVAHRKHVVWTPRAGEPQQHVAPHFTAVAVTSDGSVGFTSEGEAHAVAGPPKRVAKAPEDFLPRIGGACTYDPKRNGVLWISGVAVTGSRVPKEAWLLANGALEPVALKPTIGVTGASAAFSPALDRVVVAGGSSKWSTPTPSPTFEVDGGKTAAFDHFACDAAATDDITGIAVFASSKQSGAYLGGGTWHRFDKTPDDASAVWYSPQTRTLHAICRDGPLTTEYELAVGDALDRLQITAPAPAPAKPKKPAAKKKR